MRFSRRADSLMRQAVDSKRSLMEHWGAQVRRLLDATLLLCQQCVRCASCAVACSQPLTRLLLSGAR